jgi:hypothetical protein
MNACSSSREARKSDQLRPSPHSTFTCKFQERKQSRESSINRSLVLSLFVFTTPTEPSSSYTHQIKHTTNTTMDSPTAPITPGAEASSFTLNETKLICAIMQNLTAEIQVSHQPVTLQSKLSKNSQLTPPLLSSSTSTKSPST